MPNNSVRIIAGQWRGRKINFPNESACRPTPDRVRETVFNWLQSYIHNRTCLDAFAGTGALGFEALSRGAKSCLWLEPSSTLMASLKDNACRFKAEETQFLSMTFEKWLKQKPSESFDLVFLDPPFDQGLLESACSGLESCGLLSKGALIYVESESNLESLTVPVTWSLHKSKVMSHVKAHLFMKEQ